MFTGNADWETISRINDYLINIPLIGNGDLDSAEKVVEAFRRYNVDGVMIARASLGRPWLFAQACAALRGDAIPAEPTLDEQKRILLHHFDLVVKRFGPERGTYLMRKYACCYAQGRRGARYFRTHVGKVSAPAEFFRVVDEYFPTDDGDFYSDSI